MFTCNHGAQGHTTNPTIVTVIFSLMGSFILSSCKPETNMLCILLATVSSKAKSLKNCNIDDNLKMSLSSQPKEIVCFIAEKLPFRSLVRFSRTCRKYHDLLTELITSRKKELFTQHTIEWATEDYAIKFVPGPAITDLPKDFPIDGVYFFENYEYHSRGDVNFFFYDFDKFAQKCNPPEKYIATIKTPSLQIHYHVTGCHNLSKNSRCGYWNDVIVDEVETFRLGKSKMKEFWRVVRM
jgi:hypothetical protein